MNKCSSTDVLGFAVRNPTLREIVRCQFYGNAVTGDDADKMLPHLAGNMSYDLMAVLEFDAKLSPGEGLNDSSRQFDYFLVGSHKYIF